MTLMHTTAWPSLWRGVRPLILGLHERKPPRFILGGGTGSGVRRAKVDERGLEDRYLAGDGSLEDLPIKLAEAKALAVSADASGRLLHRRRSDADARRQDLPQVSRFGRRGANVGCAVRARRIA